MIIESTWFAWMYWSVMRANHILKLAEVPIDCVADGLSVLALTFAKSVLSLLTSYWRQAFSRDCFSPRCCMLEAAAAVVMSRTSAIYLSLA